MKTMKYFQYLLGLALLASSCTKFDWDENHETVLSAFSIQSTAMEVAITSDNKEEVQTLEWEKAHAEDYSMVFYKIQFSKTEDFSQVFYTVETKNIGADHSMELTNNEINQIAEKAGIGQESTGTVCWRVQASNGISVRESANSAKMTITRPLGYSYNPKELFLMGTATSAGDDYGKWLPLRMAALDDGSGIFEIFLPLKENGDYYFVEKLADKTYRRFAINGSRLVEGVDVSSQSFGEGIYRLKVDFNQASASVASISKVDLWYDGTKDVLATMELKEAGQMVWTATFPFTATSNNYKYKFRMTETDAEGNETTVFWGYSKATALEQSTSSTADYFYAYEVDSEASISDYCYRLNKKSHDKQTLTIDLDMRASTKWYTHKVTVVGS